LNRETPVTADENGAPKPAAASAGERHWRDTPNPIDDDDSPSLEAVRRDLAKVPPVRLVVTIILLLLSLGIARYSWGLPFSRGYDVDTNRRVIHFPARPDETPIRLPIALDAERALYDARAYRATLARAVDEDPRILIISFDQETLRMTAKRSPLDRTMLAQALTNIDRLGARAIGIDILIDQPQREDPELFAALREMKTPVYFAYATSTANAADVESWQQEFMDRWFAQLEGTNIHKASIRGEADTDNVMRRWPQHVPGLPTFMPIALTGRTQFTGYEGSVLYRSPANVERNVFAEFPIQLFAEEATAQAFADQVKGRIILIGGNLPDVDRFDTPATRYTDKTISGLEVLATETAQILDGRMPGRVGGGMLWVLAVLVVMAGMFTAMLDVRPWVALGAILFQLVFFGATPFMFELIGMDTYGLPAAGWLAGWALAFAATNAADRAVTSDQRRYAQSALGKYLPRDIAAQILKDPEKLSLTGEKRLLYTLFTDIEGFTSLSHVLPPERVATLLNAYLDGMSNIVLDHGGTIDKFVGDAVVAFWGAPIARPDDGDRAIAAAIAMTDFTANFALKDSNDGAMLGRTRVGMHYGEAVVGNFGGEGRLSYTALGDAMNCAARLEGANKYLKSVALISQEARDRSTSDVFRPMGRIAVSGRATPIVVWEPAQHMDPTERAVLCRLWTEFDAGRLTALDEIKQICLTHSKDTALACFATRLSEVGPGGTFELREK
jgi:adenylate cyclase